MMHAMASRSLWKTDFVMNESRANTVVEKVLKEEGLLIKDTAVELLSRGLQSHLRDILESAMTSCRRRRNRNGVQSFDNVQQVLRSHRGEPSIECRMNIGMKWGLDVLSALQEEERANARTVSEQAAAEEASSVEELREADLERQRASRRPSATAGETNEPWWTKEVGSTAEGL